MGAAWPTSNRAAHGWDSLCPTHLRRWLHRHPVHCWNGVIVSAESPVDELSRQGFLRSRVVPLVWDDRGKVTCIASGFFFRRAGKHFLVSAWHCLKDFRTTPEVIGAPISAVGSRVAMRPFGGGLLEWSESADLAVFRLDNAGAINDLVTGRWVFMTDADVEAKPSTKRRLIAGWPGAGVRQDADAVGGTLLVREVDVVDDPDAAQKIDKLPIDVFVAMPRYDTVSSIVGISGSPIWALERSGELKLWAMEHGVAYGRYIQGTCWGVIDEVIRRAAASRTNSG